MDLLSVVELRQALPEHDLPAGARGTVVELLDDSTVLVEFAAADGVAQCIVPVALELLEPQDAGQRAFSADATNLLVELLRWHQNPVLRTPGGRYSLNAQRRHLLSRAERNPGLTPNYADPGWLSAIWQQARAAAPASSAELPENCPWSLAKILEIDWFPD